MVWLRLKNLGMEKDIGRKNTSMPKNILYICQTKRPWQNTPNNHGINILDAGCVCKFNLYELMP